MANNIYPLEVLENKFESQVITALNLSQLTTIDTSMADLNAGMTKKVVTWSYTGDVEEVAMNEGNTQDIETSYVTKDYEVGTTQGRFTYTDEEEMINPMVVDVGLKGLAEKFINNINVKTINELKKGQQVLNYSTSVSFDDFADAVALFGENEEGLQGLIHPSMKASLRKSLKEDLKYVEAYVRTGYIGTVCGVNIIVSNVAPENEVIICTKEAVTTFVKKGSEMETQRDANLRKNEVFSRKVMLVALTNQKKVVRLVPTGGTFSAKNK